MEQSGLGVAGVVDGALRKRKLAPGEIRYFLKCESHRQSIAANRTKTLENLLSMRLNGDKFGVAPITLSTPGQRKTSRKTPMPEPPNKNNFREWFANAKTPPPKASASWFRIRGSHFERALYHLLAAESLSPRTSFKPKSEQIDGAFECVQRYFLLEAKWQAKPIGLKELDAFHAKVERKLSGTLGVFISMSGYPRGASDSLLKAKSLKIVLFGADDMEACFDPAIGFKAVLSAKLRAASEYGLPYHEFRPLVVAPVEAPNSGRSTEGQ